MIYVIINPYSSSGRSQKIWEEHKALFLECHGAHDVVYTDGKNDATFLAQKALKNGYTWIIAFGGDGTVNEVINGFYENEILINKEAVLSVIMNGTGCDFQRSFSNCLSVKEQIEGLQKAENTKLDLIKIIDADKKVRYCNNITSIGLGSYVSALVNESKYIHFLKKINGTFAFFVASFVALLRFRNRHFNIKIDNDETMNIKAKEIVIANGKYYGGGMKIAPDAELFSRKLEMIIIGDISLWSFILHNKKLYRGEHLALPKIERKAVKNLFIDSAHPLSLQVDGENFGSIAAHLSVVESAINFKIPLTNVD